MWVFKGIGIVILYVITFISYIVGVVFLNFDQMIIVSIAIISALIAISIFDVYKAFKLKDNKKLKFRIIRWILNGILILSVVGIMLIINSEYEVKWHKDEKLFMAMIDFVAEPEEYDEKFINTNYLNNEIIHTKEQEIGLDLIKAYIDESIVNGKEILGEFDSSDVRVKLDYDNEVFKNRRGVDYQVGGFYLSNTKTFYLPVEDIYEDLIKVSGIKRSENTEEIQLINHKLTVKHEYSHHMFNDFLKHHQIDANQIPHWIDEGLASYIGSIGEIASASYNIREVVPFNEISDIKSWNESSEKNGGQTYNQAQIAIDMIIFEKGKLALRDILLNTKNMSFDKAFEKVIGKSFIDFEKEFKKEFENGFKDYNSKNREILKSNTEEIEVETLIKYIKSNPKNANSYIELWKKGWEENIKTEILEAGIKNNPDSKELMEFFRNVNEK